MIEFVEYVLSLACVWFAGELALKGDRRHCGLYIMLCGAFSWLLVTDILSHFISVGYLQYAYLRPIVAHVLILIGLLYTANATIKRR